ncbi:MAG TPA: hypothetical protein VGN98_18440, partial [Tianweitania sediminis]|nr:hypothetical protein [Tianweitania sediminis]
MAGFFLNELVVGRTFERGVRRIVTEKDNVSFTAMTHHPAEWHLDEGYCRSEIEFGQRIVTSSFTLGLVVGISVGDTGTTVACLGWARARCGFRVPCSMAAHSAP